jgi:hypothetical protein
VSVAGEKLWLYLQTPATKEQANETLKKWSRDLALPNEEIVRLHIASSQAYVQQRLTAAQQQRDTLSAQSTSANDTVSALKNEIGGLPDRVASAKQTTADAEAKLAQPKAAYQSALTQENIAYSEYSYWENASYAHTACIVLEMWGMGGPCGRFNDSAFSSARFRYNSAKAQSDTAKAAYNAVYKDYEAKYNVYKSLFDRQQTVQAELAANDANARTLTTNLQAAEGHLTASHDVTDLLNAVTLKAAQFDSAKSRLTGSAQKGVQGDWKKSFASVALSRAILDSLRSSIVSDFTSFRAQTPDLPDPQKEPEPETTATAAPETPAAVSG